MKDAKKKDNIRCYIQTVLQIMIDYSFINSALLKQEIVNMIKNLSTVFFLCNWCKDKYKQNTNKLLNGPRTDYDICDENQKHATEYSKKRKR